MSEKSVFRKESLERLASPERLDQLMTVVNPVGWVPLGVACLLVGGAVTWSVIGRIPITVSGQGVLIYPRRVVPLQATNNGRIQKLLIKVGDPLKVGEVIAHIDLPEVAKQLQQQTQKLQELQSQDRQATDLQTLRQQIETSAIEQQRQSLEQRITNTAALLPVIQEKSINAITQERQELKQQRQLIQALIPDLERRLVTRRQLFDRKEKDEYGKEVKAPAITEDIVLQVQQEKLDVITRIANLDTRLKELETREAEAVRVFRDNNNLLLDLRAQQRELDNRIAAGRQQSLEIRTQRKNQIMEVQATIGQLELQLKKDSQIRAQHNGRILELNVGTGQVISPGLRLGTLELTDDQDPDLVAISYFSVEDGKKIEQQRRYLQNFQKKLSAQVTPATVRRERFGGIKAQVEAVSSFPITRESATTIIGNQEVVESITSRRAQIEVRMRLEKSATDSGYAWSSSKGPTGKITAGTTTLVRVVVEEVPPITFALPFLRTFFGLS